MSIAATADATDSRFFEGRDHTELEVAHVYKYFHADGPHFEHGLEFNVTSTGGMGVQIYAGAAFIQGHWCYIYTTYTLAIAANAAGSTRYDRIVLRLLRSQNKVTVAIRQGVAGAGLPALEQTSTGNYEIALAHVAVASGAVAISAGSIVNEQSGTGFAALPNTGVRLHIGVNTAQDGIFIGSSNAASPAIRMANHIYPSSMTGWMILGLGLAGSTYLGGAGDVSLYTGGAAGGKLILGTNNAARMIIGTDASISFAATHYAGIRMALKQASNVAGGGMRFYRSDSDTTFTDLWMDASSAFTIGTNGGYMWKMLQSNGAWYPYHDLLQNLGGTANRLGYGWFGYGIGLGITSNPSYLIHLSADSAGKPTTGTWSIISDPRTKDEKAYRPFDDYGLQDVLEMEPVYYTYNGEFGTPEGEEGVGLDTRDIDRKDKQARMSRRDRLVIPAQQDGDDDIEDELLTMNYHLLPFILINGMKEMHNLMTDEIRKLEKRMKALEGRTQSGGKA